MFVSGFGFQTDSKVSQVETDSVKFYTPLPSNDVSPAWLTGGLSRKNYLLVIDKSASNREKLTFNFESNFIRV